MKTQLYMKFSLNLKIVFFILCVAIPIMNKVSVVSAVMEEVSDTNQGVCV